MNDFARTHNLNAIKIILQRSIYNMNMIDYMKDKVQGTVYNLYPCDNFNTFCGKT